MEAMGSSNGNGNGHGRTSVLVMRNHGICTTGRTVGEAWVKAWYFEKCCKLQMDVLKAQRPYRVVSPELLRRAKLSLETEFPVSAYIILHYYACVLRHRQRIAH
jgi:ribulose-5-phosphate 4-epimerase/fuculose-1-phosphate aldolase